MSPMLIARLEEGRAPIFDQSFAFLDGMTVAEAQRALDRGFVFGSPHSIAALRILRLVAQIEEDQRWLLWKSCEWNDLPKCGNIHGSYGQKQLLERLSALEEMISCSGVPRE